MKGYEEQSEEVCGDCRHFRLHYIRMTENYYVSIRYGHCVYPMLKKRRTEERCPHWSPVEAKDGNS